MNRFKLNAFLSEFPWLRAVAGERNFDDLDIIKVKRIDENLLSHTPEIEEVTGSVVNIYEGEKILFVDIKGEIIGQVTSAYNFRSNYAHTDPYDKEGENILEAIDRLEIADQIAFIVSIEFGYEIVDHYSSDNWAIVIYKSSKNTSILEEISKAQKKALDTVKGEIDF